MEYVTMPEPPEKKEHFYTGIGSRRTPKDVQLKMIYLAKELERMLYILRSGGAKGADKAFELGIQHGRKKIYYPGHTSVEAWKLVREVHPNPEEAMKYMTFLGRNPYQLLGDNLDDPSDFVVCWTPKGEVVGGSLVVIKLADKYDVPVFNLYHDSPEKVIGYAMMVLNDD